MLSINAVKDALVHLLSNAWNGVEHDTTEEHHETKQPQCKHVVSKLIVTHSCNTKHVITLTAMLARATYMYMLHIIMLLDKKVTCIRLLSTENYL